MKKIILFVVALTTVCLISCNKNKADIEITETFGLSFDLPDFSEESLSLINAYYDAIGLDANSEDAREEVTITADSYEDAKESFLALMSKAEQTIGSSLDSVSGTYTVRAGSLSNLEQIYEMQYGIPSNDRVVTYSTYHGGNAVMPAEGTYIKDIFVDHFWTSLKAYNFYKKKGVAYISTDMSIGTWHTGNYVHISFTFTNDINEAVSDVFVYCNNGGGTSDTQIYRGVTYQAARELDSGCCNHPISLNKGVAGSGKNDLYIYYTKDHSKPWIKQSLLVPIFAVAHVGDFNLNDVSYTQTGDYRELMAGTPWYSQAYNPDMKLEQRHDDGSVDVIHGVDFNRGCPNSDYEHMILFWKNLD